MTEFSRSDSQAIYLGSDPERVDLVCDSPHVSGVHCRILRGPDGVWLVEDLQSSNGTWVRGARLPAMQPTAVVLGERIALGRRLGFWLDRLHLSKLLDEPFVAPVGIQLAPDPRAAAVESANRGGTEVFKAVDSLRVTDVAAMNNLRAAAEAMARGSSGGASAPAGRPEAAPTVVAPPSREAVSISIGYSDSNDVVVANPVVSGRHVRLYRDNDRWLIEDQGSTNGTWVAGDRITLAQLTPGQAFSLGSHRMVLDDELRALIEAKARGEGRVEGTVALASGRVLTVGRDASNDVVLEAAMVSSRHATITVLANQQGYLVEDLGSTNGTFVNNRQNRIAAVVQVSLDDVLYFGSYRLPVARIASMVDRASMGTTGAVGSVGKRRFTIGRDIETSDVVVDRPQVSRRHVEVTVLGGGRFELRDLDSANGVFVNGERIRGRQVVGPDDTIALGSWALHLDADGRVQHRDYAGDMIVQAQRVSVDVRDPKAPGGRKRILHDVSFTAYPTEFVGLMGPSGAGKTTLMMALNGYTPPATGRSLVNGVDLYANYNSFRGNIGYVPQDDIVFPQLTVYESLYYTARLRLPADTTRAEIDAKIDAILAKLEIQQARDVLIGDALKKGISGGQRKRVNLAQELITEPALLFLDEPTSGLASEDTINVMRLLRSMADDGRTILLTIHQPSLEAYRLMDNVIYLVQGRMAYYGPAYPDSILYFHPEVPEGASREKLLADPGSALKPLAVEQRRAFEAATAAEREERVGAMVERRRTEYQNSRYFREYVYDRAGPQGALDVQISKGKKQKTDRRGVLRQLAILTARTARIKWKDHVNTAILMVQAPIIAGVLAAVFAAPGGVGSYFESVARGPAALFLLVASAVWFGCSNSAREIVSEQAIYRRERMVNLMIPSYVLSKVAVLGVVCAIQCLVLLLVVYFPLDLQGHFGAMYGILLLTSLAGLGMGLTLSAIVASVEAAVALVPLLLIPQIILGGVIMPVHEMNSAMRVLSSTMVARWGFEAMLNVEFGDDDLGTLRQECGIPECVWSIGTTGYTYYSGDPSEQNESEESGGAQSLAEGPVPFVDPEDEPICQAFCASVRAGKEITPIDRSFGADREEDVRVEAVADIVTDGRAPAEYTVPKPSARAGLQACVAVLAAVVVFLKALVMAILKYRDVEVG